MLNNILLHLLGIQNTVIDGQTTQCEVSQRVIPRAYEIYYNYFRSYLFVLGTSKTNIS